MDDTGGWRFAQAFGDKGDIEEITEADIISAVEFDPSGDFLATGDKGGRIVLFERNRSKRACEYKFYTEFQSHEAEFDYLKSLEIEEKINAIRWCGRANGAHSLISTNDKTIKLWKVFEKSLRVVAQTNHYDGQRPLPAPTDLRRLRLPSMLLNEKIIAAVPRKTYSNAHAYHIHSISVNSDQETYISADDLRINLWNLGVDNKSFNILDLKPDNMEELTEVITSASFHPSECSMFLFATSKGAVRVGDLRAGATVDGHEGLRYEDPPPPASSSFFSEIISSISDASWSADGTKILARDYLSLKVWDVRQQSRPLRSIHVHDHLRNRLCDLYENDCIFDKWEGVWGSDGKQVLTGSYSNYFRVLDVEQDEGAVGRDVVLQADKSVLKTRRAAGSKSLRDAMTNEAPDYNKKILHASWHPRESTVAIAATNSLFVYSAI